MKDLELKANVLKGLIDLMKGKEKESWDEVMKSDDSEEESSEEEECDCGKKDCTICSKKPKGVLVEEISIESIPKKK